MTNEIYTELMALVERAKAARNSFPTLKALDTLPAVTMADEIGRLGGDFIKLSVKFKQAAREEAENTAKTRPKWVAPRINAERMAEAMVKRGCQRITL
ncbi:MAG: hypothetical protein RL651_302 [Pseudomonadota bacterium]|jgi:hypothetical protein